MDPAKGKPEEKAVFSQHCGDETTTYYNRAKGFSRHTMGLKQPNPMTVFPPLAFRQLKRQEPAAMTGPKGKAGKRDSIRAKVFEKGGEGAWGRGGKNFLQKVFPSPPPAPHLSFSKDFRVYQIPVLRFYGMLPSVRCIVLLKRRV